MEKSLDMRKCRYCTHCIVGDAVYCDKRKRTYSESYAKSTNNCGDFELNVIDAFFENERGYQPREPKPTVDDRQITFEELEI